MTKPTITIHNAETGEIVEREMTKNELDQLEADRILSQELKENQATKAAEKAALLERLGMTADEAALLLS
jgi:hypothetical protein